LLPTSPWLEIAQNFLNAGYRTDTRVELMLAMLDFFFNAMGSIVALVIQGRLHQRVP
jgi:hypothetical protein